jgi:CP family cyanate transporter-like MFS transporter
MPRRSRPGIFFTILGVLVVGLNLRPAIVALAPVLDDIKLDHHLSAAAAGLLTSVPLMSFVLLSTFAPRFGRRLGYGRAILWSLILLFVGFGIRLIPSTAALFTGMAVLGVAITVGNILIPAYTKAEYPDYAGPLTAVYTVSLYLGPALAAAGTLPLMHILGSWQLAIAAWGLLAVIAIPIWWPHATQEHIDRRDGSSNAQSVSTEARTKLWADPLAWAVTVYFAILSILFYTISAWLPTLLTGAGEDPTTASRMLSLINIAAIPFALGISLAVYRTKGQVWATTAGTVLLGAGLIGLLLSPTQGTALWMIVFGAGHGTATGIAYSLPLLRARNSSQTAALGGLSQTAGYSLSALGPVGAGALHDIVGSWKPILAILIGLVSIQFVAGLFAGRNRFLRH